MSGPIIYPPQPLSYEQYLSEEPVKRRYDIINGVRVFSAPPSIRHQCILGNVLSAVSDYADTHDAVTLYAPFDVLISRSPFCTRQPDVMLMSKRRWQQHGADDGRPLTVPPGLVVEILSSADRELSLFHKLKDYSATGVTECWVVTPDTQSIGVMRLSTQEAGTLTVYGRGQTAVSVTFEGLSSPADDVFAV